MAVVIALIRAILSFIAGGFLYFTGRRQAAMKADLDQAKDTILADKLRREVDYDIDQDTGLVDRAKRAGLVRPDGK